MLPASLQKAAEDHPCFAAVWEDEDAVVACDPARPNEELGVIRCGSCLRSHLAVPSTLLQRKYGRPCWGDEVSQLTQKSRGIEFSFAGYHYANGNGFWLCAAYYPCGLFLLDPSKNSGPTDCVDLLIRAFQQGVARPTHKLMTDRTSYSNPDDVYLSPDSPISAITSRNQLLTSSLVSRSYASRWKRVSVVEFYPATQPVATPAAPALLALPTPPPASKQASPPTQPPPRAARAAALGEICEKCGGEVKERYLFVSRFIGCHCTKLP
ncbi:MAG: hypothetical protein HY791_39405 [Deltaproteobacteria bacterium]|nr:hypothetical protein [Deltaproteobacteria bacterium]